MPASVAEVMSLVLAFIQALKADVIIISVLIIGAAVVIYERVSQLRS